MDHKTADEIWSGWQIDNCSYWRIHFQNDYTIFILFASKFIGKPISYNEQVYFKLRDHM